MVRPVDRWPGVLVALDTRVCTCYLTCMSNRQNTPAATLSDLTLAYIGLHGIVRTAAEKLGVTEAEALVALRENADSPWVQQMIAFAADTLSPLV